MQKLKQFAFLWNSIQNGLYKYYKCWMLAPSGKRYQFAFHIFAKNDEEWRQKRLSYFGEERFDYYYYRFDFLRMYVLHIITIHAVDAFKLKTFQQQQQQKYAHNKFQFIQKMTK